MCNKLYLLLRQGLVAVPSLSGKRLPVRPDGVGSHKWYRPPGRRPGTISRARSADGLQNEDEISVARRVLARGGEVSLSVLRDRGAFDRGELAVRRVEPSGRDFPLQTAKVHGQ